MKRRDFIKSFTAAALISAPVLANHVKPKEDDFYSFFRKFNGFDINFHQRQMYEIHIREPRGPINGLFNRRTGATVFLLTLAAWYASKEKNVTYCGHSTRAKMHYSDAYKNKLRDSGVVVKTAVNFTSYPNSLVSSKNTLTIFDNVPYRDRSRFVRDFITIETTELYPTRYSNMVAYDIPGVKYA